MTTLGNWAGSAWRFYARFYAGFHRPLALSIAIAVAQSATVLPIAKLVQYAFDTAIPAGHARFLAPIGLALLLMNLLNAGAALWTRHISLTVTKIAVRRLREMLLEWCYARSRSYYGDADLGRLHARIVQDTERVDVMSNALVAQMLPAVATTAVLGAVLIVLNWRLFLVLVGVVPVMVIANRRMGRMVRARVDAFYQAFATFSKGVYFVLKMMDLTRIQTAERLELERQHQNLEAVRIASGSMAWLSTAHSAAQQVIVSSCGILILAIGGVSVVRQSMTLGGLLSFYVAFGMLGNHLRTIAAALPQLIVGHASLAALLSLTQVEDLPSYSGQTRIAFEGRLSLEAVGFQYKGRPVLRNVTLSLGPGETVAIVGPNGAGKSTLVHLILGFYRPQSGRLYADGHPFDELDLADLRRQIGVVPQDPIIFPGTVSENIAYGCDEATTDRVIRAAQRAVAHEFIDRLAQGYDTFVGENGMLLSGGQRQLIAIARALVRQPTLLILDEPTNHLDEATVGRLISNLTAMADRPTTLVISHDPRVLSVAHRTYGLWDGRIVDTARPPGAADARRVDGALSPASETSVGARGAS